MIASFIVCSSKDQPTDVVGYASLNEKQLTDLSFQAFTSLLQPLPQVWRDLADHEQLVHVGCQLSQAFQLGLLVDAKEATKNVEHELHLLAVSKFLLANRLGPATDVDRTMVAAAQEVLPPGKTSVWR